MFDPCWGAEHRAMIRCGARLAQLSVSAGERYPQACPRARHATPGRPGKINPPCQAPAAHRRITDVWKCVRHPHVVLFSATLRSRISFFCIEE
jgi:hypothetical protein